MRAIFGAGFKLTSKGAFAISVVVAFLYAITDEIHQTFVFGRSASISDALSDLIGSGLGSYFYLVRKL